MNFIARALLALWRTSTFTVAVFCLAVALFDLSVRNALDTYGVSANGAVVAPPPSELLAGQAVITFQTAIGETITAKPSITRRGDLTTGEPINVTYIPHRPRVFAIEPRPSSSATPAIGLVIAVLALIPTLLWIWRSWHLLLPPRIVLGQTAGGGYTNAFVRRWAVVIAVFGFVLLPLGKIIWTTIDFTAPPSASLSTVGNWHAAEATVVAKALSSTSSGAAPALTVSFKTSTDEPATPIKSQMTVGQQLFDALKVDDRIFIRYDRNDPRRVLYGLTEPRSDVVALLVMLAIAIAGAVAAYSARNRISQHLTGALNTTRLALLVTVNLMFAFFLGMGLSNQFRWEFLTKDVAMGEIVDYQVHHGTPYATFTFKTSDGQEITRHRDFAADEIERPDEIAKGKRLPIVYIVATPTYNRPLFVEEQMAQNRKIMIVVLFLMIIACGVVASVGVAPVLDRLRGPSNGPAVPSSRLDRFVHPKT